MVIAKKPLQSERTPRWNIMKFSGMNKLKSKGYLAALKIFLGNTTWVPCCTDVEYENAEAYPL